jgi:hypothetical protein
MNVNNHEMSIDYLELQLKNEFHIMKMKNQ